MKEDPFRLNAKPEQKMESKMYEFFEGVKKNSETIKKLGENLVFATAVIGFLLVCAGYEHVQTYASIGSACRCRHR